MHSIGWQSYFSVGIANFDQHHNDAINSLNKIYIEFVNNAPTQDLAIMLNSLRENIENHAILEETIMNSFEYPDIGIHKFSHNQFFKLFDKLYLNLKKGGAEFSLKMYATISYSILSHILYEDSEMSEYIIRQDN